MAAPSAAASAAADFGGGGFQKHRVVERSPCAIVSAAEPETASAAASFAGEPREVLLYRLEFSDLALEGDALIGVGDAERQDRFQRAGGLHAADGRAHQHQRCAVEAGRRRRAARAA